MAKQSDHGVKAGDELMLWCVGGRSLMRRVTFPPPVEIQVENGIYVLNDAAANPADWQYVLIE